MPTVPLYTHPVTNATFVQLRRHTALQTFFVDNAVSFPRRIYAGPTVSLQMNSVTDAAFSQLQKCIALQTFPAAGPASTPGTQPHHLDASAALAAPQATESSHESLPPGCCSFLQQGGHAWHFSSRTSWHRPLCTGPSSPTPSGRSRRPGPRTAPPWTWASPTWLASFPPHRGQMGLGPLGSLPSGAHPRLQRQPKKFFFFELKCRTSSCVRENRSGGPHTQVRSVRGT